MRLDNYNANISPTEFELLVKEYFEGVGRNLKNFKATHDKKFKRNDGEYQIDIFAEFEELGVSFKILVECKKHRNDIKRDVVQLLFDKIRAIGAHKGIIFATSSFQSGAYQFANEHGIALIRIIEGRLTFVTKGVEQKEQELPSWVDIPKYVGEFINGASITYLQKGCFEEFEKFLFVKE
jgi:restriction system protein